MNRELNFQSEAAPERGENGEAEAVVVKVRGWSYDTGFW